MGSFGKPMGILFGNGPYWKAARKAVVKALRDCRMMDASHVEELFSDEIHNVLANLLKLLENSPTAVVSANHITDQAALNGVFKMFFGRKPLKDDPVESRLVELVASANENFSLGFCAADLFPFFKYFPMMVPSGRQNLKVCNAIYDMVANERERRRKLHSNHQDFLNTFLEEVEANKGSNPNYFTFECVQTTFRDLFIAGSEINVFAEHLIFFMASNKEDQKQVQDEIDQVIEPDRFPTYEDRKSMIYTQAVIQETLRLGSITPASLRMNRQNCQLGGMNIKKGTYLVPLYIGVNHSEELWEDPMLFKPARFISDDSGQITNTDKTLTFSYGPRACPGELVGRVSLFLFTVALLREFDWELSDMHPPPSPEFCGGMTKTRAEYFVKIRHRRT